MSKRTKKIGLILISGLILTLLLSQAPLALSQAERPPIVPEKTEGLLIPTTQESTTGEEAALLYGFFPSITQTIIGITGGAALLFVIIGGIQILTAYGNDEKITQGKKTITYALAGLLVAILAYAIVSIISAIRLQPQQEAGEGQQPAGQEQPSQLGPTPLD